MDEALLKQISILDLKPDDVVVLMYDGILPEHVRISLEQMMKGVPSLKDHDVIVLEDSMKIGLIRKL